MASHVQPIGNWNGFSLRMETGGSLHSAHQHKRHMLRLQVRGAILNAWTSDAISGRIILEPGSLALISSGASHGRCTNTPHAGEEPAQMVALLSEVMMQEVGNTAFLRAAQIELREVRNFRDLQLERLLWTLYESDLQDEPRQLLFNEMISNAIAIHLIGNYATSRYPFLQHKGGISRRRMKRVLEYIESCLDKSPTITALAETAQMSPFHFSRAFKQSMGISPYQYVLARKIEQAQLLLKNHPDLTISDVSLSLGFTRQNHFSRVFHNLTGLTPTAFRRNL